MRGRDEPESEVNDILASPNREERLGRGAELFMGHRERLCTMVRLRLDRRISTSDVLQDAHLEVQRRIDEYLRATPMPFYLWLRRVTAQKLLEIERHHLGMQRRAAGRETPAGPGGSPQATSEGLALALVGDDPSPSEAAARKRYLRALRRFKKVLAKVPGIRWDLDR